MQKRQQPAAAASVGSASECGRARAETNKTKLGTTRAFCAASSSAFRAQMTARNVVARASADAILRENNSKRDKFRCFRRSSTRVGGGATSRASASSSARAQMTKKMYALRVASFQNAPTPGARLSSIIKRAQTRFDDDQRCSAQTLQCGCVRAPALRAHRARRRQFRCSARNVHHFEYDAPRTTTTRLRSRAMRRRQTPPPLPIASTMIAIRSIRR